MRNYVITWVNDDNDVLHTSVIETDSLGDALGQATQIVNDVDGATQVFIEVEA